MLKIRKITEIIIKENQLLNLSPHEKTASRTHLPACKKA
jgi:hypothetical protein